VALYQVDGEEPLRPPVNGDLRQADSQASKRVARGVL